MLPICLQYLDCRINAPTRQERESSTCQDKLNRLYESVLSKQNPEQARNLRSRAIIENKVSKEPLLLLVRKHIDAREGLVQEFLSDMEYRGISSDFSRRACKLMEKVAPEDEERVLYAFRIVKNLFDGEDQIIGGLQEVIEHPTGELAELSALCKSMHPRIRILEEGGLISILKTLAPQERLGFCQCAKRLGKLPTSYTQALKIVQKLPYNERETFCQAVVEQGQCPESWFSNWCRSRQDKLSWIEEVRPDLYEVAKKTDWFSCIPESELEEFCSRMLSVLKDVPVHEDCMPLFTQIIYCPELLASCGEILRQASLQSVQIQWIADRIADVPYEAKSAYCQVACFDITKCEEIFVRGEVNPSIYATMAWLLQGLEHSPALDEVLEFNTQHLLLLKEQLSQSSWHEKNENERLQWLQVGKQLSRLAGAEEEKLHSKDFFASHLPHVEKIIRCIKADLRFVSSACRIGKVSPESMEPCMRFLMEKEPEPWGLFWQEMEFFNDAELQKRVECFALLPQDLWSQLDLHNMVECLKQVPQGRQAVLARSIIACLQEESLVIQDSEELLQWIAYGVKNSWDEVDINEIIPLALQGLRPHFDVDFKMLDQLKNLGRGERSWFVESLQDILTQYSLFNPEEIYEIFVKLPLEKREDPVEIANLLMHAEQIVCQVPEIGYGAAVQGMLCIPRGEREEFLSIFVQCQKEAPYLSAYHLFKEAASCPREERTEEEMRDVAQIARLLVEKQVNDLTDVLQSLFGMSMKERREFVEGVLPLLDKTVPEEATDVYRQIAFLPRQERLQILGALQMWIPPVEEKIVYMTDIISLLLAYDFHSRERLIREMNTACAEGEWTVDRIRGALNMSQFFPLDWMDSVLKRAPTLYFKTNILAQLKNSTQYFCDRDMEDELRRFLRERVCTIQDTAVLRVFSSYVLKYDACCSAFYIKEDLEDFRGLVQFMRNIISAPGRKNPGRIFLTHHRVARQKTPRISSFREESEGHTYAVCQKRLKDLPRGKIEKIHLPSGIDTKRVLAFCRDFSDRVRLLDPKGIVYSIGFIKKVINQLENASQRLAALNQISLEGISSERKEAISKEKNDCKVTLMEKYSFPAKLQLELAVYEMTGNYYQDLLRNIRENLYLKGLLAQAGSENVSLDSAYFFKILEYIFSLDPVVKEGEILSEQESAFLKMSASIQSCDVGKKEELESYYYNLPKRYQYDTPFGPIGEESAQAYVEQVLQRVMHGLLSNSIELMLSMADLEDAPENRERISREIVHQSLYLKNRLCHHIGLRHTITWDLQANCVEEGILCKDLSQLLSIFYRYFTPKVLIEEMAKDFNRLPKELSGKVYQSLYRLQDLPPMDRDILYEKEVARTASYWDLESGELRLTEAGACEVLVRAGYLQRIL